MKIFGGIEAGGSKFICGVGTSPDDLKTVRISTRTPETTIAEVLAFFRQERDLQAIGIGSFGPIDPDPSSATFGRITSTPKVAWRNFDFAGAIRDGLSLPVAFDTDVNAAALGESRWGAAQGIPNSIYLTVGTGIGGGAIVQGQILHGLLHPEMGHIRVPHDPLADPYGGCCPYHADCLEGLASGPAIRARWGLAPEEIPPDHPAWGLEARYLALAVCNLALVLSPQRIVIGGGVMQQPGLISQVRWEIESLLGGYVDLKQSMNSFLVTPDLGWRAGVLGALAMGAALVSGCGTPLRP